MLVSALLASVGINVGLCIVLVLLASLLRKQPYNVDVYAPRTLVEDRSKQTEGVVRWWDRFLPSTGWIVEAWRTSDDQFIAIAGFDAYVLIRMFILSLRMFSVAGIIGICILLPINYLGTELDISDIPNQSLDLFTISNVQNGSKRLWVHFCAVYVISGAACCLLFFEYKNITTKRIAYFNSSPPQPNHFTLLVRGIPKSDQHTLSDTVEEFFTQYHPSTYLSHQMVYQTGKVQALMHEAKMLYKRLVQLKSTPRLQRKTRREGFLGIFGAKVDPVDHYTKKLEEVEENVRLGQSEFNQRAKELRAAFVSFKSRHGAAIVSKIPQSTNPLLWVTQPAPEPRDVYWPFLSAPYIQLWISKFIVWVAAFFLTILFLVPVAFVQALAQLDELEKYFPFLEKVVKIKVFSEIITGYLPSLILLIFMYVIPPIMMIFSAMQGSVSNSGKQKSATIKVLYFTIWNVFFASVLSGSALTEIDNFISNPKDIPRQLAVVVPGQATFFISYVLTSGWTGLAVDIARLFPLILNFFRKHSCIGKEDDTPSFPYHRDVPKVLLFGLLGFTYSILAPLILPVLLVYFAFGYIIFRNQMLDVYSPKYEIYGQYWPIVHNCTIFSLVFMQILAIGIFGLKEMPYASGWVIPAIIITLLFNNYCGKRFSPMIYNYPAEVLIKRDKEDERNPQMGSFLQSLITAYRDPVLDPLNYSNNENDNTTYLLASQI